jgi:hypothetical protein
LYEEGVMAQERAQSREGKLGLVKGHDEESSGEPPTVEDGDAGDLPDLTPEAESGGGRKLRFSFGERRKFSPLDAAPESSTSGTSEAPRRRGSLAERLQQRKAAETQADSAPDSAADDTAPALEREKPMRRRPAGPPPRRLAAPANDDLPSIGGLIFALQQKPSRLPFVIALGCSVLWFVLGGVLSFNLLTAQGATAGPWTLTSVMMILVPIAIFWFLALLVWRAQELRLMASAMTEVAVRLAEPDKLAEQSVASLGQVIRRQVAAMNDGISRAIGRASELEALVHNEVAALERSYGDNETRVRGLISELASEREALANNSERVANALRGVGQQVAHDIASASNEIDKSLADRGLKLTELMIARSNEAAAEVYKAQESIAARVPVLLQNLSQEQQGLTQLVKTAVENLAALETVVGERTGLFDKTMRERTAALDNTMRERTAALTQSVAQRIQNLEGLVGQGTMMIDKTLAERTKVLGGAIDRGAQTLVKILEDGTEVFAIAADESAGGLETALRKRTEAFTSAINQGAVALDKTLAERTGAFADSLAQRSQALEGSITESMTKLDQTLAERSNAVTKTLAEHSAAIDKTLAERSEAVKQGLSDRLKAIDTTFQQRSVEVDRVLTSHVRSAEDMFGKQTAHLHKVLADNSNALKETARIVGQQSGQAVEVLSRQTETLKHVSSGLLDQIHALTQRFESQGQGILAAAQALESSNTKIDSILESRHQAIIGLLHTVNGKAQELDGQMQNYVGIIQNAMADAEARARHASQLLARDTSTQAQQAVAQIEKLRADAQAHTARAVEDLKTSFSRVIGQIGQQMEQMRGQFDHTSKGMREAARQTVTDLEMLRRDMQARMDALPQQTAQATAAIRKALADQMSEIEAITPMLSKVANQLPERDNGQWRPAPSPSPAPLRGKAIPPVRDYDYSPLPQFDAYGRPTGGEIGDIGAVAGNLAQQLSSASSYPAADRQFAGEPAPQSAPRPQQRQERGMPAARPAQPAPAARSGGSTLRLDEIARAIEPRVAAEVWQRYRAGEQGVLGPHLYTREGQATFDEINRRYAQDAEFRSTVDRYMSDFERLLGEAEQADPDGRMLDAYLVSETGRVYLLLANASGRLR